MRITRSLVALTAATALGTPLVSVAGAQRTTDRAFVRVTAKDSSGAPLAAAELTIRSGLRDVVAQARTDDEGHAVLSVPAKDSTDYQLTLRKIGYPRGDRFFGVAPKDTADVKLIVPRPRLASLEAVTVTAKRESKYSSYDLDADEIENATGFIANGWDVVKALRPAMLTSRGGCESGAREVWVNGKRIRLPLMPTGLEAQRALVNAPIRTRVSYVPISVLSTIAPEHIQEIHYHDCFDRSMAAVGNNDAIFVTLKPGVIYVQDVGSFVVSSDEEQRLKGKK